MTPRGAHDDLPPAAPAAHTSGIRTTRRRRAALITAAAGGSAVIFALAALPSANAAGGQLLGSGAGAWPASSADASTLTEAVAAGTSTAATATPAATATASPQPIPKPKPLPPIRPAVRPPFIFDPIPWGVDRQRQMAAYSMRHYGEYEWRLTPKQIVLHYTVSNTYKSVWWDWSSPGTPYYAYGELPRPAAHFVVDQDGTIYCTVPVNLRVRNAIGLNHVAIGIEFVEMSSADNIFARNRQRNAGVALVRWLEYRYRIPKNDVIGHGFANSSRYFKDLLGRKNTHVDWNPAQVRRFRALL